MYSIYYSLLPLLVRYDSSVPQSHVHTLPNTPTATTPTVAAEDMSEAPDSKVQRAIENNNSFQPFDEMNLLSCAVYPGSLGPDQFLACYDVDSSR